MTSLGTNDTETVQTKRSQTKQYISLSGQIECQRNRMRRRVVSVLGVMVVLATALALMLPAISMTRTNAPQGTLMAGSVANLGASAQQASDESKNPYGLGGQTFVIVNRKNNQDSALTASVSQQNASCLAATNIANTTTAPSSIRWTFEYTGTGMEFLVHDQSGNYLVINEGSVALATKEQAAKNPIVVEYDNTKDRYALKAKNSSQALNNYGSSGFGRWSFDANNQDFWMQLRSPESLSKPGTIATADTRAEGIAINLFDYGPDSLDAEGNTVGKLTNNGINNGHPLKFVSHGTTGDSLNHYTGGTNEAGTDGSKYRAMQGILQPALSGGYPVLTGYTVETNGSLQYLFDPAVAADGKTSYADVNHLFTKDEKGYYQFDSNMNYAYYDTSAANANRDFKVYANSFNEEGTVQDEKVGFFPFDDYDSYYNCIHGGTPGDQNNGFKYYGPHNGTYSNKLGHYNHHFGMSMTADFVMTPDGTFNGEDMTFSFSGDDDMWVFVDGVLVLDIGGIHNPVSGSINFRTGDVAVSAAKTVQGQSGAQAGPTSLEQAFSRVDGKDWDPTPYKTHKLQVFYLERGGMYSNCKIGFNLPTYKTLSLSKRLTGLTEAERAKYEDEEFTYEVIVNGEPYNGSDTARLDATGEVIEQGFAIVNGQISIKDGETVTIAGLKRTDTFYAAEEKSLNMEQFEAPHAERVYERYENDQTVVCEEEIALTQSHTEAAPKELDDWKTLTYELEDTEKVTFTNTLREKDLEVEKKWEGAGAHPDEATFTVSASVRGDDGELVPYAVSVLKEADGTTDKLFALNEANSWRADVERLPVHTPEGKLIRYDVKEVNVEGYVSSIRDLTAETYNYCNVDVVKLWPDGAERSEVITVMLENGEGKFYAGVDDDGEAIFADESEDAVFELNSNNGYAHRFERLPYGDTYKAVQVADEDDHTKGLVTYVHNVIQYEVKNTPTGQQVDPEVPQDNPVIHKRIDALRDGAANPDSPHAGDDLTDLYRLYLDYRVDSLQSASGVDLLFVIDHSGSMNSNRYGGNQYRARSVMEALNGDGGLIAQFLDMNKDADGKTKNRWAAVGFKGPYGYLYTSPYGSPYYRSESAGENDSEILSGEKDDYTWKQVTRDISLPLEGTGTILVGFLDWARVGETVLTDYTAGFWRAEQFLLQDDVINDGRKKAVVFISDGIPTLHIEGLDQSESLVGAGTATGSKYYPDDDGGCPDQAKTQFGYFINDMKTNGYTLGGNMEFYAIGFGGTMQSEAGEGLLRDMLDIAYEGKDHKGHFMTIDDVSSSSSYSNAAAEKLKEDLRTIMGMNETFSNIVIQDDLSAYVELVEAEGEDDLLKSAKAKVTMTVPDADDPTDATKAQVVTLYQDGAPVDADDAKFEKQGGGTATIVSRLEYDSTTKTVKVVFDPEYEAVEGVTYTLSFDVNATDEAYETYAENGYDTYTSGENQGQIIVGDAGTDYRGTSPANATSAGKPGFRSNDEAKTTFDHNGTPDEKTYPHPVIQVFDAKVRLLKTDQEGNPLANAKFKLYKDAYDASGTAEAQAANAANCLGELVSMLVDANAGAADGQGAADDAGAGEGASQDAGAGAAQDAAATQVAEIAVKDLRPGVYYLVETEAPAGYFVCEPVKIEVKVKTETVDGASVDHVEVTASVGDEKLPADKLSEADGLWTLEVMNSAGYELPSTGGAGTGTLYLVGAVLVCLACVRILTSKPA